MKEQHNCRECGGTYIGKYGGECACKESIVVLTDNHKKKIPEKHPDNLQNNQKNI